MLNITKPLEDAEIKIIQEGVDEVYDLFKRRVANGRDALDVAGVDSIGQGRVWSGIDAVEIGLVDELGGIRDAINYAAEMSEIEEDDVCVIEYPLIEDNDLEVLLEQFAEAMDEGKDKKEPGLSMQLMKQLKAIDEVTGMKGIQARLPFELYFNNQITR
jgi:protease-4